MNRRLTCVFIASSAVIVGLLLANVAAHSLLLSRSSPLPSPSPSSTPNPSFTPALPHTPTPTPTLTPTPTPTPAPTPTPDHNLIFQDNFESGDLGKWSGTMTSMENSPSPDTWTTPIVSLENPYEGQRSLESAPTAHSQAAYELINPTSTVHLRMYVYFSKLPTSQTADPTENVVTIASIMPWNNYANIVNTGIYNDNGAVRWLIDSSPAYPDPGSPPKPRALSSTSLAAQQWYCVELSASVTGNVYSCNLWVNQQNTLSYSFTVSSPTSFDSYLVGGYDKNLNDGIAVYIDNVAASLNYIGG